LLDQDRVDIDEWKGRVHVEHDLMIRKASLAALQRRVNDVGGLDPFKLRLDLVPADAGGVQEVLDVGVEGLSLVAHGAWAQARRTVLRTRGRAAQTRRGAEDRG